MIETKNSDKGFTLVELLIAISLIAILSGVLLGVLNPLGIQKTSRDSQRISDLAKIKVALENYFADNRAYPTNGSAWVKASGTSLPLSALVSSYTARVPADPKAVVTTDCSVAGWREYYYWSDGNTYKLITNLELSDKSNGTCSSVASGCDCTNVNIYYTTAE